MKPKLWTLSLVLLVGIALSLSAIAQQTTGVPGSPSATSTIDGRQIPPPRANFGGTINLDATDARRDAVAIIHSKCAEPIFSCISYWVSPRARLLSGARWAKKKPRGAPGLRGETLTHRPS